jgi:hypothetical protein
MTFKPKKNVFQNMQREWMFKARKDCAKCFELLEGSAWSFTITVAASVRMMLILLNLADHLLKAQAFVLKAEA